MERLTSQEWTDLPTSIGREQDIATSYDPSTTAILLVDPYNDFLSDGGKLWARVKAVAEEVKLLDHLREVVSIARARGLKIFSVPHHRGQRADLRHGLHAPLLIHLAEEDEFISKPAQPKIKTALAGKPNATVYSYPGQNHAFARHNGAHYNAAAAALANGRTSEFLH